MNVLVVGGAGYVGSHTVRKLMEHGEEVWVYDNLSRGHAAAVPAGRLIEGNMSDRSKLVQVMQEKEIDAVMHFAAYALVNESVTQPAMYYQNNVVAALDLMEAMRSAGVWRFVFSSTTATYGEVAKMPITEDNLQLPINPYGFSKLVIERALQDYAAAYGFGVACLRYFNAAGASEDGSIGEDHDPETHIIPIVLQVALGQREFVSMFGRDYATPDGSCIRDYIHVNDLASAHLSAMQLLEPGQVMKMNLGSGKGASVLEVIEACRKVTGHAIPVVDAPRREGDPASLIADITLAKKTLDWAPKYNDIESIVATAWNWHSKHPHGYKDYAADNN